MPIIAPFRGLRYNSKKVRSLAKVVTPPYDVISSEDQEGYYASHRFNFIRLVYGREYPTDTHEQNRYARARRTLEEWLNAGVLELDAEPNLYPYRQNYTLSGRRHQRWGMIALVRLDSPRIYPHEETKGVPRQDRLRLLEKVEASLSPLFGLVPDRTGRYKKFLQAGCRSRKPIGSVRAGGVVHRLWKASNPLWLKTAARLLRSKELIIADGHHRFEAAVAYRESRRLKESTYSPEAPYNYAMFYLSAAGAEEPGLLPTHRLLKKVPPRQLEVLWASLQKRVQVRRMKGEPLFRRLELLRKKGTIAIGLYIGARSGFLLQPRERSSYHLDVEWLHQELLPEWIAAGAEISYTQDVPWALSQIRQGKGQLLFVMQPPRLKEVIARARSLARMPGKTTYFHPKPLAGLVEYLFASRGAPVQSAESLGSATNDCHSALEHCRGGH